MALTVLIRVPGVGQAGADDLPSGDSLSLTLDAPRIVIGRGKGCEVQLPDPTVSARHACIRMQGGKNLIVDEGSDNGLTVGRVRLPPHTPRAVADGERIRVGRVWLELRFGGSGVASSPREVRGVALQLLKHQLAAEGEAVDAYLEVVEGPDAGARLVLHDPEREYVIGRSRDVDLRLGEPLSSRRHLAVARDGDRWLVRDLGSKRGACWVEPGGDETPLGARRPWGDGMVRIGDTLLALRDPLAEALEELRDAAVVKMKPSEHDAPPPWPDEVPDAGEVIEAPSDAPPEEAEPEPEPEPTPTITVVESQPRGLAYATVDLLVALVAIGLTTLSIAGLMYVLG